MKLRSIRFISLMVLACVSGQAWAADSSALKAGKLDQGKPKPKRATSFYQPKKEKVTPGTKYAKEMYDPVDKPIKSEELPGLKVTAGIRQIGRDVEKTTEVLKMLPKRTKVEPVVIKVPEKEPKKTPEQQFPVIKTKEERDAELAVVKEAAKRTFVEQPGPRASVEFVKVQEQAQEEVNKFKNSTKDEQVNYLSGIVKWTFQDTNLSDKSRKKFSKEALKAAKNEFGKGSEEYKAIDQLIKSENEAVKGKKQPFVKRHKKKLMIGGAIGLGIGLLAAGIGIGYAIGSASNDEIKEEIAIREETVANLDGEIKEIEDTLAPTPEQKEELEDLKEEKDRLEEELSDLREELADRDKEKEQLEEQKATLEADDQSRDEALKQLEALFDQIITEEGSEVEGDVESIYRQDLDEETVD
ncbi:MAG: hypothetical protein H6679_04125 [Epsilonproteobacteria bacterium]|nr:hypothetical protein [Campylobacterota bacterium]